MSPSYVQPPLHAIDLQPTPIAVVAEEVRAALLPRLVILTDATRKEHRIAGFLRLRASGGIIDAARRIPAGTVVWWQGQRMQLERVEGQ